MTTQKKTEKVVLVQSSFNYDEAKEVLLGLIDSKIRFHENRNFSLEERTGKPDQHSEKRIAALKEERKKVLELLQNTDPLHAVFTIDAVVGIAVDFPESTHKSL